MERSVLRGLAAFRWAAWIWMATVLWLARGNLVRPALAAGLVVAALVVTVVLTVLLQTRPQALLAWPALTAELGVAVALQVADGFVYRAGHVFSPEQPLGVAWPIAAALSVGVARGSLAGVLAGVAIGAGRAVSSVWHVAPQGPDTLVLFGVLTPPQALSLLSSTVLYCLAGGVGGYAMRLVREAGNRIATAEAAAAGAAAEAAAARDREEMARRLHDGVLQTLAVVERRADDPQLARLARDQERDLRNFLFGHEHGRLVGVGALGDALRHAASRHELAFGGRVEVLVPDDLPDLPAARIEAVTGAVREALTNAGKHGEAQRIVVYVEPEGDHGLFCSVRDDGHGFDPATAQPGVGLSRSIRARIEEVGGIVEVDSAPGRGTEVRLHLPATPNR